MTNKEFYFDKLLAVILNHVCNDLHKNLFGKFCDNKNCLKCEFKDVGTIENWLNTEHKEPEPPLLENGDGLKPGDWIMVRDGDGVSWRKRQFMCYFVNRFYCFKPHSQFKNECDCVMWVQARLPMEGE